MLTRVLIGVFHALLARPAVVPCIEQASVSPGPARGVSPQVTEAVRLLMQAGGVWTAEQILVELKQRGWDPQASKRPIRSIRAALYRLRDRAEVEQVGRSKYRYVGAPALAWRERRSR